MELLPQQSLERNEKKEGQKKTYEYRDSEGNLICKGEIVYSKKSKRIPGSTDGEMGREILSYTLSKEVDGKMCEVDLFKLTGIDALGYKGFVCDGYMINQHSDKEKTIVAEIESPLGVATFLHEAGHAVQFNDKKFDGIKQEYSLLERASSFGLEGMRYESILNIAKKFGLENNPNIAGALREYKQCYDASIDLKVAKIKLERERDQLQKQVLDPKSKIEQIQFFEESIIQNSVKYKTNLTKSLEIVKQLDALIRLPQRTLERDATRRAIEWMRHIFETTGIDLFVDVHMPESMLEKEEIAWSDKKEKASEETCNGSTVGLFGRMKKFVARKMKGIKTNAETRLYGHGFSTYGADDEQMKKDYGFIPEMLEEYMEPEENSFEQRMAA